MKDVVRIQAWFRGNRCRKQLSQEMMYRKVSGIKKYTEEKKAYAPKTTDGPERLERRPEYTFKNGALYTGEWLVGADEVRHGRGT